MLHAPTPTDEAVDLPGLLLASFPLDPSRRHVAPGPLRDALVKAAAVAYTDAVVELARTAPAGALALVPGPVPAGQLDAELRRAIVEALAGAPVLPGGVRPDEALAVDGIPDEAFAVLAEAVPGLVAPAWAGRRELDRLGVRRQRLADLVDELAELSRPTTWWLALYDGLDAGHLDLEALSGLPVPLVDGRLVRGPRGVVLAPDDAERLTPLGLRVAAISHPLLERLGAVPADPATVLRLPGVLAQVAESLQADDPGPLAAAVLGLVAAAGGAHPELSALALLDDRGDWVPAGELLLAGGVLASVLAPDQLGTVATELVDRWGADVLTAVGVMGSFAVLVDADVSVEPDATDHDLDDEDGYLDHLLDEVGADGLPPVLVELVAIRDLDLVEDWPAALREIAAEPRLRAAVVEPARVLTDDGRSTEVPSYSAWYLRRRPVLAGRAPTELALASAGLAGLRDSVPELGLDDGFLRAIGVVASLAEIAESPMYLPLLRAGLVPSPSLRPDAAGVAQPVPAVVRRVLVDGPPTYVEHDDLAVAGVPCDWWVDDEGVVHAATVDGLARGLAWSGGRWGSRLLIAALLAEPERVDELLTEQAWE